MPNHQYASICCRLDLADEPACQARGGQNCAWIPFKTRLSLSLSVWFSWGFFNCQITSETHQNAHDPTHTHTPLQAYSMKLSLMRWAGCCCDLSLFRPDPQQMTQERDQSLKRLINPSAHRSGWNSGRPARAAAPSAGRSYTLGSLCFHLKLCLSPL